MKTSKRKKTMEWYIRHFMRKGQGPRLAKRHATLMMKATNG